jgi:hypothetical protein
MIGIERPKLIFFLFGSYKKAIFFLIKLTIILSKSLPIDLIRANNLKKNN